MDASKEIPPNPEVEAFIANISELMAEAERMLNDSSSQHAEAQIFLLRTRFDAVRAHVAASFAAAGRAISDGAQNTDRAIRANPYQALAIALGAGLVAGLLLGRRSD